MNYATIKRCDIANGPGIRLSLFVSGCRLHCKNCFNKEAWDFEYGEKFTQDTIDYIIKELSPSFVNGLTILGGEPFATENQPEIVNMLRQVKKALPNKSIWAFSGYLFDKDILPGNLCDPEITKEYLSYLDVLVDGPFIEEKKDLSLRFRGSQNQRIIDVKKTLETGEIILWNDWLGDAKGMKI